MFVLVSKKAAAAKVPTPTAPAPQSSARTQNACDACRIRKAKCDGHTPCGRCRARQLVCTTSRRHPKASGPITEEHVATLQEQQRRLTRAVTRMADVIKQAESRGFVEDSCTTSNQELSPLELAETLQRFAPDDQAAEANSSPTNKSNLPAKKRKLRDITSLDQDTDVTMDDSTPATANKKTYQPFERFFATVQQHNTNNPDLTTGTFQQTPADPTIQRSQTFPMSNPQDMTFGAPVEGSAFEFHPQMAPFMDMVDWDASLDHFLNSQYDEGNLDDWDLGGADLGLQGGTLG